MMSKNNVTDIDTVRRKRAGVAGASPGSEVQTVTQTETGAESPKNALKTRDNSKQVRTVGRPKGAKDKKPRKIRYDNSQTMIPADDRQRIAMHNLELFNLGTLNDKNDEVEVQERIERYFRICAKNAVMPTVAGFALSLGIDRGTLWDWMDGRRGTIKNPVVVDVLKRIYSMLNAQYEELLTEGKMVPVGAFFLMQNNHGYKNQTDHVVVAASDPEPDTNDIAARAGLLEDGND